MTDSRFRQLARTVVRHSLNVQPGENVCIEAYDVNDKLAVTMLMEEVFAAGGRPFVELTDYKINRKLRMLGTDEQFALEAAFKLERVKIMDAFIQLLGEENVAELSDVPEDRRQAYNTAHREMRELRHSKRWVLLNYPTVAYAQLANMSTEAYTEFLYNTCTMDYSKLSLAMDPLAALMTETDQVRIVAPGTDLRFSIAGFQGTKCDGRINLPDGEVFTAPVRDSVNGTITFNTKTSYNGYSFTNVSLTFEHGKVVSTISDNNEKLNEILDTDEGSRYIGEFAIGLNPFVDRITNDVAFDEKISGSLHIALGEAYEQADNGNKSDTHWDLVLLLKPAFGGGEIYFDDRLISKDGRFMIDSLLPLNPENLS